MKVELFACTDGKGHWSSVKKEVLVTASGVQDCGIEENKGCT